MENGKQKTEKMENGQWKTENGKWKTKNGQTYARIDGEIFPVI